MTTPGVNDLIRGTRQPAEPPAEQSPEQARQSALGQAARQAKAHSPATVVRLLATSTDDPAAAVLALQRTSPDLFRWTDLGAGEGRTADSMPEVSAAVDPFADWRPV